MNDVKKTNIKINIKNIFYKKELELSLLIVYFIMVLIFSSLARTYFTLINFTTIFSNISVIGITSIGLAIVVLSGNIDLTVGAVSAFAGSLVVVLDALYPNIPILIKVLVCLIAGFIWGSINGLIVTKIKLNSVITTLAMMSIIRGISYSITTKHSMLYNRGVMKYTSINLFKFLPISLIYLIIFIVFFIFILTRTRFGKSIYATGDSIDSAKLMGINTSHIQYWSFVISSICATIAGLILVGQVRVGRADNALGNEFDALAIVILGGIALKGGRGNIIGVVIAMVLFMSIANGLVHLGLAMFWKDVVKGLILIIAISIDVIRRRKSLFQVIT